MRAIICRAIAWGAATDAGNRSMFAAGRKVWNEEDWNSAVKEFKRLGYGEDEVGVTVVVPL